MWLRLDFCNLYITFVYEMKTFSNFLGEILICKEKFGHHFSLKNFKNREVTFLKIAKFT